MQDPGLDPDTKRETNLNEVCIYLVINSTTYSKSTVLT